MRASKIEQYLGGASNVYVYSALRGTQRRWTGTIVDDSDNPLDITNFTLSIGKSFLMRASVTITTERAVETANFTSLTRDADTATILTGTPTVIVTDAANGEFELVMPHNLFASDFVFPLDAVVDVPTSFVSITYQDRADMTSAIIEKNRILTIYRDA